MTQADEFDPGHADRVTVLHLNFTSTRILTASADHRIKVWERDSASGEQTLTDTWTAHDADIRDVRPVVCSTEGSAELTVLRRNGCIPQLVPILPL
jgi:WD40 repeat protein